ncbi:hypothetical protein AArcSl_2336 [Halalkaliarchaeum desulfuricum]|uniref:Uncharacterized protein n=1 Tax=Halalkaliarchaeum desulfuricum TaxID=2055893 RepID=A0A343TLI6_9EURY|nr:hypothetical protein [Halalkaliarchaeum desulfuricum]AUX09958.1 hypothetical protein AArcSl_2336 [Halalkaliarchaeum desulfuricum]
MVTHVRIAATGVSPLAVAGTFGLLAAFLSLTAFLAARNVLGDVPAVKALGVGPFPAAVAVVAGALDLPSALAIGVALLLDGAAIHYLYGESPRLSAYITLIHVVVTILLGTVLFGLLILLGTLPG